MLCLDKGKLGLKDTKTEYNTLWLVYGCRSSVQVNPMNQINDEKLMGKEISCRNKTLADYFDIKKHITPSKMWSLFNVFGCFRSMTWEG